jgi:2-oxoisovalerate dehydrogenase E1 component
MGARKSAPGQLLSAYEAMARHRAFEEVTAQAAADGRLPGLLHLSIGVEAATAGVIGELREQDRIFSTHRPHGHFLAAGETPLALFAELAGRETGVCRGRGGSMHLMGTRAVMASGVVGGTLPIALGYSLALDADAIAVAFFGDGAVQTGLFHETLNMAALWKAPVLFVCENNGWAEFSSRDEHTTVEHVADYGAVYRVAAQAADGGAVADVAEATRALAATVRETRVPALLELQVSRLRPHYESKAAPRSAEGADPLHELAQRLGAGDELERVSAAAMEEMTEALEQALEQPPADPADDAALLFAADPGRRPARPRAAAAGEPDTVIKMVREELAAQMEADPAVMVLGEDVAAGGPFGLTRGLAELHGADRVRNTPISESAIMGVAVGLALAGRKPVVDLMFDDFLTLASDQLFNHAAKLHFMSGGRSSVGLCVWTTGGAGTRWGAQHSQRLDGLLASMPGLKVLAPTTPAMAAASLAAGIQDPDPVVVLADRTLLYKRWSLPGDDGSPFRSRLVRRGDRLTIAASGRTVMLALEAVEALGVSADVIDLQRIAPLDTSLLVPSVERTSKLLVAHDEAAGAGLAEKVASQAYGGAFWSLDAPIEIVTSAGTPVPAAPELEDAHQVSREAIEAGIRRLTSR